MSERLGTPVHGTFRDGVTRVHRSWTLPGARARLLLVHGMGEHGGRYAEFATPILRLGAELHVLDLRGHGLSGGLPLHVDRFERFVEDLADFAAERRADAELPTFLIGHSLGAIVAGHTALQHPAIARGLALLGAPFAAPRIVPRAKRWFGPPLAHLFPRLRVSPTFGPEVLAHDPAVGEAFRRDPLCRERATLRFGAEALRAIAALDHRAGELGLPVLLLHGADDVIAPAEGARAFHERLGSADRAIHVIADARHELHHERAPARERFHFHLQEWLERLL